MLLLAEGQQIVISHRAVNLPIPRRLSVNRARRARSMSIEAWRNSILIITDTIRARDRRQATAPAGFARHSHVFFTAHAYFCLYSTGNVCVRSPIGCVLRPRRLWRHPPRGGRGGVRWSKALRLFPSKWSALSELQRQQPAHPYVMFHWNET